MLDHSSGLSSERGLYYTVQFIVTGFLYILNKIILNLYKTKFSNG